MYSEMQEPNQGNDDLLRSYKTEIDPTESQKVKINQTLGVCRYVYNLFVEKNMECYVNGEWFIDNGTFSKWLNNDYVPNNPDKSWIKDVSSHSVRYAIDCADNAFDNFFKRKCGFPKFKKRGKSNVKMYFVRAGKNYVIKCERHRIKIPAFGWVKLKEKGYLPLSSKGYHIRHGYISCEAGRYYVSVTVEVFERTLDCEETESIGVDLGVKEFATCSNGKVFENINNSKNVRKLEKRLRREQRSLSRMFEAKKRGRESQKNIDKQKLKIQKTRQRLDNIKFDYINKVIWEIVRTKPSSITIKDLNVPGMMKNHYLFEAIGDQKLFEFQRRLIEKCHEYGIEIRIVEKFYPSSKTCHNCGCVRKDMELSDVVYKCTECGYTEDRDFNASLNLRDATSYRVA